MTQIEQNQIPVTFANLFTCRPLLQAALPTLPTLGDDVILNNVGYEVAHCKWQIQENESVEVLVLVMPQIDENGERPLMITLKLHRFCRL